MKKIIFTGIVALCLFSCGKPKENDSSATAPVAHVENAKASAEPFSSPLEMAKAFVVAFGQPAPAKVAMTIDPTVSSDREIFDFNPEALFELSPGVFVLISDGINEVDCHACSGHLAIHYLTLEKGEYKTLGRWLDVGGRAPYGQAAKWTIRHDIEANPIIWTTTEDGGQGCGNTSHDIISLLPARAVASAQGIRTEVTYDGGVDGTPWKTEGQLVPGADLQSFSIKYSGKYNKTDHYEKYQGKYISLQSDDAVGLSC